MLKTSTIFITIALAFLLLAFLFVQNQNQERKFLEEQTRIQKEAHILAVFAEYKNNVDSCRQAAQQQGKDEEFIRANCLEVINSSLVGDLLRGWGKEDLLITK